MITLPDFSSQNMPKNDLQILAVSRPAIPETRPRLTIGDSMVSAGFPSPSDDLYETFDIVAHIVPSVDTNRNHAQIK